MIRSVLVVAMITVVAIGVTAAIAQQDPIKARKDLMKTNGDQAKIGAAMVKGDRPFDLAAVHKIFATFEDAAVKMPALFPDNTKSEVNSSEADDFSPTPKVWEDMADFKARFVKFGEDAKAAAATVKDLDSFKVAFGNIGKNHCGACHELYRAKKS
jgi:cytochrome c556